MKRTVTYWEDEFSCIDRIDIEFDNEEDFKKQMDFHAKTLMKEGYELAGARWLDIKE